MPFVKLGNHETAIILFFFFFFFPEIHAVRVWMESQYLQNTYRVIETNDQSRGQSSESSNYVLDILDKKEGDRGEKYHKLTLAVFSHVCSEAEYIRRDCLYQCVM